MTPNETETRPDGAGAATHGARYLAFLETIHHLRPRLHRYCARMTGSVLDGEDVVQEALFDAYRKLDSFEEGRPLAPWLFRIAHNRSVDFLRRKGVLEEAEAEAASPDWVAPVDPPGPALGRAVEYLVRTLPPKERASVLLKDVFDYSLEEVADLVGSTVGGVKAALSRGRSKLAALPTEPAARPPGNAPANTSHLLHLYVERFNQHDWDGLRELISADARLLVADRFDGDLIDSPYFSNYERSKTLWRVAAGEVDGEPAIIMLGREGDGWTPRSAVRLHVTGDRITRIVDYGHCPWVLRMAKDVTVG